MLTSKVILERTVVKRERKKVQEIIHKMTNVTSNNGNLTAYIKL